MVVVERRSERENQRENLGTIQCGSIGKKRNKFLWRGEDKRGVRAVVGVLHSSFLPSYFLACQ